MDASLELLANHGYWVVFACVFADQAGLPLPSFPVVVAAGALAYADRLNAPSVIAVAAFGAFLSDLLWFEFGRRRGGSLLKFVCRRSLEPDSCVERTQQVVSRRRAWTMLVSKFVPGMNVISSAMAGMGGLSRGRFLGLNAAGSLAFGLVMVAPGYLFSEQLERVLSLVTASGNSLLIFGLVLFGAYLVVKYARRARFLRMLRVARISPEELKGRLETGSGVVIVDLRLPADFAAAPLTLPGAIRVPPAEMSRRNAEIPRDQEIVLYCSCPDEDTSARVALLLNQYGIHRVRPLAGGFESWRERNFPLIPAATASPALQ